MCNLGWQVQGLGLGWLVGDDLGLVAITSCSHSGPVGLLLVALGGRPPVFVCVAVSVVVEAVRRQTQ